MDRERQASSSFSVGLRSWVLVLLFSLLILLFLSSSSCGFRPFPRRNGWDTLNVFLVIIAILCGVLSLRHGAGDGDRLPRPAEHGDWHQAHSGYRHAVEASPAAEGLRMRSGSGSYPVLRPSLDAGDEEWRFYGNVQHYRQGSESGAREGGKFGDSEAKTIAVDTYVERRSPLERSRSPPSLLPPTQWLMGSRVLDELPEGHRKKDEIFEPEKPHPPSQPPPPPPERQSRMTRRNRVRKVTEEKEVEKNEIFGQEHYHQSSPSPPRRQRQPRRTLKKFRKSDAGQNAISEATMTAIPLPASMKLGHGRRRSFRDVPQWEVEQNPNFLVEKPHAPLLDPPPTLPSPPQLQEYEEEEEEVMVEKASHKKRRGSGAKDITAAIALFYRKRKGSKTKISSNDTAFLSEEPASSAAPPPPPTLPSSAFHHLFYQKKGGSKTRRIHSKSAAPPPPPPTPPPPERQSTQQAIQPPPPASAPPPPSHNWHHPRLPPAPPSRSEKSNLSKRTISASSPMTPSSPPPPPPRPSHFHQIVTDDEVALVNPNLNRRVVERQATKAKEREAVAVSCPSPDVDNKADLFIAQCHANWKLEKQNSMRQKERRKQRRQQEAEQGRA